MPLTDDLLNAIREHRATKTPAQWSPADLALYAMLPEMPDPAPVTRLGRLNPDRGERAPAA